MLFNSYAFVGVFLPVTLLGYFVLLRVQRRVALGFVTLASLVFYAYWDWRFLPLILGSIAFNYLVSRAVDRAPGRGPLVLGIAVNLAVLGFFKYALFFLGSAGLAANAPDFLRNIVLPLGISFWTFQQIAYLVDVRRRVVRPAPLDAHAFSMVFFPHLIAGPILNYANISRQFLRPRWPAGFLPDSFQVGVLIFAIGLFKKVAIADTLAPFAEPVFNLAATRDLSWGDAWIGTLAYTFQLYFDFSGYSDMAYGLARMFGFRIPINFWSPYKAKSIIDFWARWHRSLTGFFRQYLYIPLGGNRRGLARQLVNIMIVFVLTGFWHGAGWAFIAWGAGHGILVALAHLWRRTKARLGIRLPLPVVRTLVSRVVTLALVILLWVLFRAEDFDAAMRVYEGMAFQNHPRVSIVFTNFSDYLLAPILIAGAAAIALFAPNTFQLSRIMRRLAARPQGLGWAVPAAFAGVLLYVAIASFARGEATFLYFNF